MSVPPPSAPPPGGGAPAGRTREIVVPLAAVRKGLRGRLGGAKHGEVRLRGAELTIAHDAAMREPLTLPGGQVEAAAVDRGSTDRLADHGRFAILRRIGPNRVIPRKHGIEGWLWTTRQGSTLPSLIEDEVPNVALLFTKPLDAEVIERHFLPQWVAAVAERSPLGKPAVPGLLLAAESALAAEEAFRQFGVLKELTDREVPPTMRRHLPGDKPADPTVRGGDDDQRASGSVAPPGR